MNAIPDRHISEARGLQPQPERMQEHRPGLREQRVELAFIDEPTEVAHPAGEGDARPKPAATIPNST